MKTKTKNFKKVDTSCPECKHKTLLQDNYHEEIYCPQCGRIIQENIIFNIINYINEVKFKESYLRSLWKKKKE